MAKKNKILTKVLAIILILLASFSLYLFSNKNSTNLTSPTLMKVDVIKIKKENIAKEIEYGAKISAVKISEIRPQISGYIKKVKFVEGSKVKKNQILYQIDSEVASSQYLSAKSNFDAAKKKFNRYQNLVSEKLISKQEFEEVETAFYQAKANFSQAKKNLDFTKVLAPISGYIGKNNFAEGSLVVENQVEKLTTITQIDNLYLDIEIPSLDYQLFQNQKNLLVKIIDDNQQEIASGKISVIEKNIDQSTDTISVRAIIANNEGKLLPSMFVSAKVVFDEKNVVLVPQRATFRDAKSNLSVMSVDENNILKTQIIDAKETHQNFWIVESGLNEDDVIVYQGFQKLKDGSEIEPIITIN